MFDLVEQCDELAPERLPVFAVGGVAVCFGGWIWASHVGIPERHDETLTTPYLESYGITLEKTW
jgi:hypothetical protein